jgi:hypothetical protein
MFFWFATPKNPRRDDALELMGRDLADGGIGMKLSPAYHALPADDRR